MRRLAVEIILEAQRFPVETVLFVADLLHRPADGGLDLVERTRRPGAIFIDALAADKIGRAHVWNPVTNTHLVCRLLLEKKKQKAHDDQTNQQTNRKSTTDKLT